jgi:hypothetical protein
MAYGLWRVMAFVFMAYGGESKIDEKAIIRIIRRNTAKLVFLSKKRQNVPYFSDFSENLAVFEPFLRKETPFIQQFFERLKSDKNKNIFEHSFC